MDVYWLHWRRPGRTLRLFREGLPIVHILWDFDGTLIDSYPNYTKAFHQMLGRSDISEDDIFPHLKLSFTTAYVHYGVTDEQRALLQLLIREYPPSTYRPFDGVKDVLAAHSNVIMTHGPRDEVMKILHYHDMTKYFLDIITMDDGFPLKPDPASYAYLHSRKPIDLVVGDRVIDILPGKELGIRTCLFQNPSDGADYYLSDYARFHDVIDFAHS